MVIFPNCKVNIGLHITGKRADGYHNLETIFYPIGIKDALEIIEATDKSAADITFTASGNEIDVQAADNLCVKAYRLLKNDYPHLPSIIMHLHKNIPTGAGMGGGSADASAVLLLLNSKFDLQIPPSKLGEYALLLGSDCPFFIHNKPSFATGRGEILSNISLDLSPYKFLVVNPGIHINTGNAFAKLAQTDFSAKGTLQKALQAPITEWKNTVHNDFEKPVFEQYPAIEAIKEKMYNGGAIYASLSGSGSSVYGIFSKDALLNIKFPAHYFCQIV